MEKIIFTKYSNERASTLQIRTDIMQSESGEKFVLKYPMDVESKTHLEHICTSYERLTKVYEGTTILPNHCEWVNCDVLRFPFIEGKTYESMLDEKLEKKEYLTIIEMIKEYRKKLLEVLPKREFICSSKFEKVFGKVNLPVSLEATNVANIDLIFSNIVVNDVWNILDYEWTFDFIVPINFILYRAICNYLFSSGKRTELWHLDLLQLFGIAEEEKREYEKMDQMFHNYVQNGMNSLSEICISLNRVKYKSLELLPDYIPGRVQVFYDYGEGYSEEKSEFINCKEDKEKRYILLIENREGLKSVRIDPTDRQCIIRLFCLRIFGLEGEDKTEYYNNGVEVAENLFVYNTDDPQVVIPNMDENIKKVEIEFSITNITSEMAQICADLGNSVWMERNELIVAGKAAKEENEEILGELQILESALKIREEELENVKQEVEAYKEESNRLIKKIDEIQREKIQLESIVKEMQESTSWRVTEPFRKIGQIRNFGND